MTAAAETTPSGTVTRLDESPKLFLRDGTARGVASVYEGRDAGDHLPSGGTEPLVDPLANRLVVECVVDDVGRKPVGSAGGIVGPAGRPGAHVGEVPVDDVAGEVLVGDVADYPGAVDPTVSNGAYRKG